ncbi:MAG: hypothetical protein ACLTAF_12440 [Blautia coccoides]
MNIPYAQESGAQKLDLYYPNEETAHFLPLFIFMAADFYEIRRMISARHSNLTKAGYVVASCNYRLTGEAYFLAMVYDTKAATRFINVATSTIWTQTNLLRRSIAGGYLSSCWRPRGKRNIRRLSQGNPDISSKAQACIDWFGVVEFELQEEQLRRNGNSFKFSNVDSSVTDMFLSKVQDDNKEMKQEANILAILPSLCCQR